MISSFADPSPSTPYPTIKPAAAAPTRSAITISISSNEWFRIDAAWKHEIRELMKKSEDENWTVKELLFREIPEEIALALDDDNDQSNEDPLLEFEMQKSLKSLMD